MTQTFFVASKVSVMIPVEVQGTGDNSETAARSARTIAEKLLHIEQPEVLKTERARAVAIRTWAAEQERNTMRGLNLNGNRPFFRYYNN